MGRSCRSTRFLSTPSARRATFFDTYTLMAVQFLSTPSARRATPCNKQERPATKFLSTPSARRATLVSADPIAAAVISIHALREEGDQKAPAWRFAYSISIHALREEGDLRCGAAVLVLIDFYPRPPRGGRQEKSSTQNAPHRFLSTPSARRATRSRCMCRRS